MAAWKEEIVKTSVSLRWHDPDQVSGCDLSPALLGGTPLTVCQNLRIPRLKCNGTLLEAPRDPKNDPAFSHHNAFISCARP
jgi:hypothetical protein